ncbi:hypothetical protein [Arenimonas metalli]|uniref:hypothetical protein n=1 Tax=Arenimonas metalli TaxID=948077 RepID=UPI0005544B2C|nr:hypothetical protein [Arenimonas metalli]
MQWTRARRVVVLVSMLLAVAVAVALAARADAASLFKCSDRHGRVSYQSAPCAPGDTQVWERAVAADHQPASAPGAGSPTVRSAPRVSGEEVSRTVARPPRQARAVPRASAPRKSASRACQSAKAADAAYRAQPLSRVKHDGLRRHGDRIRLACGPG